MDKQILARAVSTPKAKRMSTVALTAAVLAVIWAVLDNLFVDVDAIVVSSVTSLAMLVAGFYDHKNPPTYGEDPGAGNG